MSLSGILLFLLVSDFPVAVVFVGKEKGRRPTK
jgi:hypothetical protein